MLWRSEALLRKLSLNCHAGEQGAEEKTERQLVKMGRARKPRESSKWEYFIVF